MHHVADIWGDEWIVSETRDTPHGFVVYLGRGVSRGGSRVIVTRTLAEYMEARRYMTDSIKTARLPLGRGAIKRVRRLLGHDRRLDSAAWWEDRVYDLATMTLDEFARRHSRTVGAVERARLALLGKTLRDAGWWLAHADAILTRPTADVCDLLGLSAGTVRRLRSHLAQPGGSQS